MEHSGDVIKSTGGDPINPAFILVRLLVRDPNEPGHFLLCESEHDPPLPDPLTHVPFQILGIGRNLRHSFPQSR